MIIGEINKDVVYETIEIDLKGIQTKKALLYTVSKELNFPIWDENNWDSFRDRLFALYEPYGAYKAVRIVLKNFSILDEEIRRVFYEILQESSDCGFDDNNGNRHIPCYYEIIDECESLVNNKMKKKYKETFNIVRKELNKVDPIGVVTAEEDVDEVYPTPEDKKFFEESIANEYDMENARIIPIIENYTDYKELANKICEIFVETTEMKLKPELFYECAKNILEKTKKL